MTVRRLAGPDIDPSEVAEFIDEAKSREHTITIIAECQVEYEGRAASDLGAGDRVILMKPDGTVAVHKDEKRQPVNWQPPGSNYKVVVNDGVPQIEAYRQNPEEFVIIALDTVYSAVSKRLDDNSELQLTGTEQDVVDKILDNPSLIEEGFRVMDTEWETGVGPVDIYGKDDQNNICCVEVKRGTVSPSNVMQLHRYVESVEEGKRGDVTVRGFIVGSDLSSRAENVLEREGFEFHPVTPDIDRTQRNTTLDEF